MSSIVADSEEATGEKSDFVTGINEEDEQDQRDEIYALSSIFPDTIKIEHGRILPTFSLAITVETADVNYKCAFYNYGEKMPIGTCNLTYLTPILLRVSFPTTYPSIVSPLFSIRSSGCLISKLRNFALRWMKCGLKTAQVHLLYTTGLIFLRMIP